MVLACPPEPAKQKVIRPQPGAQEAFLATSADIAITGGKAGTGKTFGLLMEPLRHIDNPGFGAVILRRTCPQITNEGGLWDTAATLYPYVSGSARRASLSWVFPSGARVRFAHMQYEDDRYDWDGSQLPLVCFDQLESFTWKQFWHIISRLRSTCGVKPYVRATCNPDPDHWLRKFLDWWIDKDTGLAIKERSGVIRWFIVINDEVHWGDTRNELLERFGDHVLPLSFTFIPGELEENKALLDKNPGYVAFLDALPMVERERLKGGNWNIRETAGTFFQRHWFKIVKAAPALDMEIRYWDRAATEDNPKGSWTAGVRMGRCSVGSGYQYYIRHVARFQGTPLAVENGVKNTASQDGPNVIARVERDPGQAGVAEAAVHVRNLAGLDVKAVNARESKGRRARGLSAQAEAGNVFLVEGDWNEAYLHEAERFDGTDKCQSDQIDGSSGAFNELANVVYAGVWGN